ncbi:SIR2 family protein [Gaetbulibacter aquiaggeris]|uniref:SIR2 family protein n=1 Tax=Gaetbulibacter aquiaggeris TaxID=1735373 RepID=A0ABW7MX30_9FLAO
MINSFQKKNGLLVGNGINLLDHSQAVSWGALLNDIKDQYDIEVDIDNEFKPFPIGFEEMLHQKDGSSSLESKLKNLKQTIRRIIDNQLFGKNGFNEYHTKICNLNYDDILTTNYDYALELSIADDFKLKKSKTYAQNKQERKFSLKRNYGDFEKTKSNIWHIHGELESSRNISPNSKQYPEESIMIGYEHYSEYLEQIQENINGKKGKRIADNQSVISRIKNKTTGTFWTDAFFTHNLDIIGFGFDFSENHLWWLLNRRAMLIRSNEEHNGNSDAVQINNTINYYYPDMPDNYNININDQDAFKKLIQKMNMAKRTKAIGDVLKSFKVNPKPIPCNTYNEFYDEFISFKTPDTK